MSETMENKKNLPGQEEVLENEATLLQGLMEAAGYKDDKSFRRKIEIRRGEKVLFSFTVRPLSEEEEIGCSRKATPKVKNRSGIPVDGKMDVPAFRSWKIYTATIDEDRKRVWDNPDFKKAKNLITAVEVIDSLLRSGDKDMVLAVIDEISGSGMNNSEVGSEGGKEPTLEDWAKN